uniref:Peptidase S54 rhomboid domain-containing protein n=1 Tax=Megaselia scalaris TaxID=36166 RepID=T1H316_MEGSC
MINYHSMRYGLLRLGAILLFASCDFGFAIYARYAALDNPLLPSVSYVAHLTGAFAGLTIGLLVLKNFEQKLHEQLLWWIALGIYAAFTIFAVTFNIFNSVEMRRIKNEYPNLVGAEDEMVFHDLG